MPENPPKPEIDVRMRGFTRRASVEAALARLDAQLQPLPAEVVALDDAAGRVLAESVSSTVDVPGFDRAMMDGFAVAAASTHGAEPQQPRTLAIVGQAFPGRPFTGHIGDGQAVRVMTGAAMPAGSDAVLPFETVEVQDDQVLITRDASHGTHVGYRGEDIAAGSSVLPAGRVLRPQDLGVLSSIGIAQLHVVRRPRVAIVITGNELLPAGSLPRGCQIVDANGPMLAALVARDGGTVEKRGIVPDDRGAILAALLADADIVVVSGGSSVGEEDHVPVLLAEQGELAIHGVAMRPSSPMGMGRLGARLVFLLPGNPVSCLCGYDFFAGRAIRALGGRSKAWPYRTVQATVGRPINSAIGRLDYIRAKLVDGRIEPIAGGSSVLSSTTRADGFVLVPADIESRPVGSETDIYLYDK